MWYRVLLLRVDEELGNGRALNGLESSISSALGGRGLDGVLVYSKKGLGVVNLRD